jgi:hypothetical protein
MKTILNMLCAAAVAGMVSNAVPAEASVWGWLERLSGPGPFDQVAGSIGLRGLCPPILNQTAKTRDSRDSVKLDWLRPRRDKHATCLYFDRADFVSHTDPFVGGTSDITAATYSIGASVLVVRWLEGAVGAGWDRFRVVATDITVTKPTLTLARVVVRPIRIFRKEDKCGGGCDVIKLYVKRDIILGTLQSSDFGVAGNFKATNDGVTSLGILFDFSELAAWK